MKHGHKKKQAPTVRSVTTKHLASIAATRQNDMEVACAYENVWLSQKMMPLSHAKGDQK